MNSVIVFHSVCGNTFLMAKAFRDSLEGHLHKVSMLRVADPDWVLKDDATGACRMVLEEMQSVSEAKPDMLVDADLIVMGSPTYFGNVSGEMKSFMDQTGGLWYNGKLTGKKFAAFASVGHSEGGADLCLAALHVYAKYMGMLSVPVPVTALPARNVPVLGPIHYSSGRYADKLNPKVDDLIRKYCACLVK